MSRVRLSGWGRYPVADCCESAPRTADDVSLLIEDAASLIARGLGRSYGDAALNRDCTMSTRHMDRLLAFDESTGMLTCESGTRLADILEAFVPRGWFPPVTPGTKFVTVGGMLAADVHGKNHHGAGSFGDYVDSFTLAQADGTVVTCASAQNADLFDATRGGMGLTGVILQVTFRLMRIASPFLRQETIRARTLDDVMALFEQSADWTYSVAWIDCLATGPQQGRSVFYRAEHAAAGDAPSSTPARRGKRIPPFFPAFALNRHTMKIFNDFYYARAREGTSFVDYDRFFYPLDAVHDWHRLYGRHGMVQYQCVLPKAASAEGLRALLSTLERAGAGSFLAILKLLGPQKGLMSFPMEGYTLALDFPVKKSLWALLDRLDDIVDRYGGRIYLAKDARTTAAHIQKQYPALPAFKALRQQENRDRKFSSLLAERLSL